MVKIVMVDVLTSFRNRYAIEVNDDEPAEYALDDIVCNQELTEFSQFHIGDQIISHRVVSEEEYLRMFDEDNDYLKEWPKEKKLVFINTDK